MQDWCGKEKNNSKKYGINWERPTSVPQMNRKDRVYKYM